MPSMPGRAPRPSSGDPAEQSIPAPPLRAPAGRRRPWLVVLGTALVAACGVAGASVLAATGDRNEVLAVAQNVAYGQQIAAEDLTTAQLSPDPAVQTVPAGDVEEVVGRVAGRDLAAGDVLSPSSTTLTRTPGTDKALTTIPLSHGQMPVQGLRSGDLIQVVSTPGEGGETPKKTPSAIDAEVLRVGNAGTDGITVVDVETASTDGPALAARVATGRIAVVVDTPGSQ